jgi:hypothetical protein
MWTKIRMCRQILVDVSNIKFRDQPSGGSRSIPCEETWRDRESLFRNCFANAPKNTHKSTCYFRKPANAKLWAALRGTSSLFQATDSSSFGHAVLRIEGRPSLLTTAAGEIVEEWLKNSWRGHMTDTKANRRLSLTAATKAAHLKVWLHWHTSRLASDKRTFAPDIWCSTSLHRHLTRKDQRSRKGVREEVEYFWVSSQNLTL